MYAGIVYGRGRLSLEGTSTNLKKEERDGVMLRRGQEWDH